jgi:acyl-CoA synthetase (NDP forming)/RimJ/RimL family protein N-acetyltransferase
VEAVPPEGRNGSGKWDADVITADGGTVHVRPIRPTDADGVVAFHARQSAESIYFRFFSPRPSLSTAEIEHLTNVDGHDRMAFVALLGEEVIGVARYDRIADRPDAEVAFFVDEEHKGRGLATILLEYLAAAARDVGIRSFTAVVLPTNRRMIGVFKQAGFDVSSRFADGVVEVHLDLEPTDEALAAMDERARSAEVRAVARLLEPSSIAVIGAGRARGGLGHELFRQLLHHGFNGSAYPVNPGAEHVAGVRARPSVLDIPDRVDVAVVAVPSSEVRSVVEQCAVARVGGLIVLSGGFGETGEEGQAEERDLVAFARRNGMRMIGPNSMGVINTDPSVQLHATFAPVETLAGGAAVSAQAGSLVAPILERARRIGLGISTAVAIGNKADVSGNDLLRYWAADERTRVVLLYLESFGNPRRFSRLVQAVSRAKPVVAVTRAPGPTTDALLAQTGVIRVDTIEEMIDVARVLERQPVMCGGRVAVLGNTGGPTTLAADACAATGLELAPLAEETVARLRALPQTSWRVSNPVEVTHPASGEDYGEALAILLSDGAVDAALVVYAAAFGVDVDEVAEAIVAASDAAPTKTIVTSLFAPGADPTLAGGERALPNFRFADAAARSLGRAAEYGRWRLRPAGAFREFDDVDAATAQAIADAALTMNPDGARLGLEESWQLVRAAGLTVVAQDVARSSDDAIAAAGALGYPVSLKATGLEQFPKTEAGGLALDLQDERELAGAYKRMCDHLGDAMVPAVVQRMARPGLDLRLRLLPDPIVGAAIGLGPGGAGGEAVLEDAVQVVPLTDSSADQLVERARCAAMLDPAAIEHLVDAILRLSWLADEVPSVAELALDPIIVTESGAVVIDVAARVAPWRLEQEPTVRRLS